MSLGETKWLGSFEWTGGKQSQVLLVGGLGKNRRWFLVVVALVLTVCERRLHDCLVRANGNLAV